MSEAEYELHTPDQQGFYEQMSDTSRLGLDYGETSDNYGEPIADGGTEIGEEEIYMLEEHEETPAVPFIGE